MNPIKMIKEIKNYKTDINFDDIYKVIFYNNVFITFENTCKKTIKNDFKLKQFKSLYMDFLKSEKKYDKTMVLPKDDKELTNVVFDLIKSGNCWFNFDSNFNIRGFVTISNIKEIKTVKIHELCINSNSRNSGLATKFLTFAEKEIAKDFNSKYLEIEVFEKNIAAKSCYEKFGFRKVNEEIVSQEDWDYIDFIFRSNT